jgi:hypothetical protein
MAEVILTSSLTSYGDESENYIYDKDGGKTLKGEDYGDLETGVDSDIIFYYLRHDGQEPIYDVGIYLKTIGVNWGGYVSSADEATIPYNPNFFRSGGIDENGIPKTSTEDYEFMRKVAYENPEMGVRIHQDRSNDAIKSNGLGYSNIGLSFSPMTLLASSMDYSKTSNAQTDGLIYPGPIDSTQYGLVGDEARIGVSIKLPDEVEGSGHIQFGVAVKYRYTI